jgi:YbbR domain-containing protein
MTFRDRLLSNFWLKLISLALASFIWITVRTNVGSGAKPLQTFPRATESRDFPGHPVLVLTEPGDRRVVQVQPQTVDVTVRGGAALMRGLRPGDIQVYVRVPASLEPVHAVPVSVDVPQDVEVDRVSPPAVIVQQAESP